MRTNEKLLTICSLMFDTLVNSVRKIEENANEHQLCYLDQTYNKIINFLDEEQARIDQFDELAPTAGPSTYDNDDLEEEDDDWEEDDLEDDDEFEDDDDDEFDDEDDDFDDEDEDFDDEDDDDDFDDDEDEDEDEDDDSDLEEDDDSDLDDEDDDY